MEQGRKTPEQIKQFAKKMTSGASIRESMIHAGFSEKQANKGRKAISKRMMRALAAEGFKLADFAKQFTIKDLGDIAVGRLAMNAMTGSDKGFNSAKTLGSHRELNLWQTESQTGVIILAAPGNVQAMLPDAPQDIDAKP